MAIKFNPKELDEQYTVNKEEISRNWFFVGSELRRIKRDFKSTKLFGQHIAKTEFSVIPNYDRSDAIWMFEYWAAVLDWIEVSLGQPASDPFRQLSIFNASHPTHIKRQVLKYRRRVEIDGPDA